MSATQEQHATAVLAALNAALAPKQAYEYDTLPTTRPAEYVEATVSRRFGGESRLSAQKGTTGWRVTTRAVAQTVSNARLLAQKATQALEDVSLTVDGKSTTPIQFETEDPIGPDDGWYSGLVTWTYTH